MRSLQNHSTWLAIGMLVVTGWIIFAADKGVLPSFITARYAFPNGDKVGHFLLMGALAFGANMLLPNRQISLFSRQILLGTFLVFIGVTVEECSQLIFQARTFSLLDLGFSYLGIVAADVGARRVFTHRDVTAD